MHGRDKWGNEIQGASDASATQGMGNVMEEMIWYFEGTILLTRQIREGCNVQESNHILQHHMYQVRYSR